MQNNEAFIAHLGNIRPIEGADKIKVASVILNNVPITQVIVGADTQENTPVVYFDANLALEDDFILAIDKLSPDFGKADFNGIGKYLAKGNRVKAVKLRGTISNGLVINVDKISQIFKGFDTKSEGYSFTEINGVKVCHKWLPPTTNRISTNGEHKNKKKRFSRIIPDQFHFYVDTAQLLRNLQDISPDDVGSISRKIHGTSAIASRALVLRKLSILDKIAKFIGVQVNDKEYTDLYASRTIIKNESPNPGGFYNSDIWTNVGSKNFAGKLHDGETVYYEIVGYIPGTQKMIQKGYDYGNKPGECSIAVYRITMTSPDGTVTSLDWNAMKERCKELNVPMVQEFYYGKLKDMYPSFNGVLNHWANPPWNEEQIQVWRTKFVEKLKEDFLEKDVWDNLGKKVPDEGIVLRIEGLGIRVYKLKSERFFTYESAAREAEVVDIEAQESI